MTNAKEEKSAELLDGRYDLGDLIGSGGMAEVWRARDTRLGRDVAVKLLSGPAARDASMRKRIEREARALAALSHRNIVGVYDYGEVEDPSGDPQPFIVMELVDGPNLDQHISSKGPLPVDETVEMLAAVLGAVEAAHAAGIVHGDLKPANVVLAGDGPKVGDFGVARILAEETGTTTLAATPTFAAPEVLRGDRPSEHSDLYSAACVAFQMLTGRPPFEGANAWEVASKHLEDPVPSVIDLRPDVPVGLADTIRRNMSKHAKRRHATAKEFKDAISSPPATTPMQSSAVGRPATKDATELLPNRPDLAHAAMLGSLAGLWERTRKWRGVLAIGAAVLVCIAALTAVIASTGGPERVAVPDVRDLTSSTATGQLRAAGFKADVTFRPVTQGPPDVVLETIPAAGELVDPGTEVHVIASALVQTPEPEEPKDPEGGGKGRGRGNKDDD